MSLVSWALLLLVAIFADMPVGIRQHVHIQGNRPVLTVKLLEEQSRIAETVVAGGSHRRDNPFAPLRPSPRFPDVENDAVTGCISGTKWRIDPNGRLSKGEYGVVYKATDGLEQTVAIKVMRLKPDNWMGLVRGSAAKLSEFTTEIAAQNLAAGMDLTVPIQDYFACGQPGNAPTLGFIVMDLVRGETLERWLLNHDTTSQDSDVKCKPIHVGTAVGAGSSGFITSEMYTDLLEAIPQLDKNGLITSDLHTANIMVDTSGPHPKMVFIDFGLPYKFEHKDGQAVKFVLSDKFGCPLPESLKYVSGFEAKYTEMGYDSDSFDDFDFDLALH